MKKKNYKSKIIFSILLYIVFLFTNNNCNNIILLHPKGKIAIEQKSLILTVIGLMLIIVIPVILMTLTFAIKYRASNINSKYNPNWNNSKKIELIIWLIPITIIIFIATISIKSTYILDPNKEIKSKTKQIIVNVISLDWKWLFIYPKYEIATINELVFPVNNPIKFILTSNTVMNSFFIPQLGGQMYAMAGMKSTLHLIANYPGKYKGISANFSGEGFSNMKFNVIVTKNKNDFETWIKKVKSSCNNINNIQDYEKLAIPSKNNKIEYFSNIKLNLLQDIINKFINTK